jgi:hypothetical protein
VLMLGSNRYQGRSLNATCEYDLIETDQREDICAFIIRAGALAGFNEADEDVTEEWREW